jgi:hypothetical protein
MCSQISFDCLTNDHHFTYAKTLGKKNPKQNKTKQNKTKPLELFSLFENMLKFVEASEHLITSMQSQICQPSQSNPILFDCITAMEPIMREQ